MGRKKKRGAQAERPRPKGTVMTRRKALNLMSAGCDPFHHIASKGRTGARERAGAMAAAPRKVRGAASNPFTLRPRCDAFDQALAAGLSRAAAMKAARRVSAA